MEEFKFVIKCLLFACLVVVFSQTKVENETLENKAYTFLQHSETAHFVRSSADGAVKLIQLGYIKIKDFASEQFSEKSSKARGRPVYSSRIIPKNEKAQQGGVAEPLGGKVYSADQKSSANDAETPFEEDRF